MNTKLVVSMFLAGMAMIPAAWGQTNEPAAAAATGTSVNPSPGEVPDTSPVFSEPPPVRLNKLGLSYRMGLNITADFNKLGGFERMTDPGPATGSTYNRTYDNGYNRVDSSGNAGGQTWYWGYQNANSVRGNSLVLQSEASPNNLSEKNISDDPQHGLELSYSRELSRGDWWRAGGEFGVGYIPLSISDSRTLRGQVNRITDTFSLGGVVPPLPPYHGTFEGPGPLIDSSPDRAQTVFSQASTVVGERKLDSDVFVFRLGPYFEVPITEKFSAIVSGGLTLVYAASDFSYTETVTISDLGQVRRSSSASEDDFLVGGYAGLTLAYAITEEFGVFAGAQYQAAGRAVSSTPTLKGHPMTNKEAVLDMGSSIVVSLGISYSF
jgi:hypothetical protein